MPRVKRGKTHLKRRRRILKQTKGYMWGRKNRLKLAKTAILKAGVHAYCGRKRKKRDFRSLWLIRLNAALREKELTYSKFIGDLKKVPIELNRKILAEIAVSHPQIFDKIVESLAEG